MGQGEERKKRGKVGWWKEGEMKREGGKENKEKKVIFSRKFREKVKARINFMSRDGSREVKKIAC